jgi:uncharacterized repeat protein (TIGR03847 family)
MADEKGLLEVDFITIGTIGAPGKRVFHLQAMGGEILVTVIIEKVQAIAISEGIITLFDTITEEFGKATPEIDLADYDFEMKEPILPLFRVGQIGLGYDDTSDGVLMLLSELLLEEQEEAPRELRLLASRELMRALSEHTGNVIEQGRPICPHCDQPIDPEGHFCPKSNGNRKPVAWA